MLDTRTMLQVAIPADRNANSNDVSFSLCRPTPRVKQSALGTNPITGSHTACRENCVGENASRGTGGRHRSETPKACQDGRARCAGRTAVSVTTMEHRVIRVAEAPGGSCERP